MNIAVLGVLVALGAAPATETATSTDAVADDIAAREAEMFGTPADDDPEVAAREAEMFGGESEPAPTPTSTTARRRRPRRGTLPTDFGSVISGGGRVLERLTDRVAELDDALTVGGTMWLQLQATFSEDTPVEDAALSSPNILDVFLDARPSDRLRAFVQGRLNYDPTGSANAAFAGTGTGNAAPEETTVQLDQLWLRFDLYRTVFVTAGKQRIRWGSGRLWNPTDFLNQQRLNPISLFDIRLGVPLVKFHLPIESLGWNFYAVANLDEADQLRRVGGAARAEFLLGNTELSVSAALRDGDARRFGIDVTAPLWDLDVRLEFAVVNGDPTPRFAPFQTDALPVTSPDDVADLVPLPESRVDDWIPQLVAGAELAVRYSDEDSVIFGAEYFFNDAGYDDEDVYLRLLLAGRFNPLDVGRHYVGFYVSLPGPGDWNDTSLFVSGIANLSDLSGVLRADLSLQLLTFLSWRVFINGFWGSGAFSPRFVVEPSLALAALDEELGPVLLGRIPVSTNVQDQLQNLFTSGAAQGGGLPIVQLGTALVIRL